MPGSRAAMTTLSEPSGSYFARVAVHVRAQVAIIERFHPVVVELEVPDFAFGHRRLDQERLVGPERPVAVQVMYVRITTRGMVEALFDRRKRVGVAWNTLNPVRKRAGRAAHERSRAAQVHRLELLHRRAATGRRTVGPARSRPARELRAVRSRNVCLTISIEVSFYHRQPVAGHLNSRLTTTSKLPSAAKDICPRIELARGRHRAVRRVPVRLRAEREVRHGAATAAKTICAIRRDRRVQIDVVGIVRTDLHGRVRRLIEDREVGI